MKRLLSLLAISATTFSSSLATISCRIGKVKKLILNVDELKKELKTDVNPNIDPYEVIYQLIVNLAGSSVSINDIKNDDKIRVLVYEDGSLLKPGDKLGVGKYITIDLEVLADDIYFQQVNRYTLYIGYLNKVTLTKNNINIDSSNIEVNTTTYANEYNTFRTQIAALAGIGAQDIKKGDEKDSVLISLIVNGNAVKSNDTIFKYGDSISMKIMTTDDSKAYNKTQDWMETNTVHLKAQLSKDVINLSSISIDKTTYANVYEWARTDIANIASIDPSVIATGSEKNNVLISLIVNGNAVAEDATTIKYGDVVSVKFEATANSRYYADTNGWIVSNEFIEKATIQNLSFNPEQIRTQYGMLYNEERMQIAKLAGIDPDIIKNGSEKDNVLISIFVNGKWISEDSKDVIKANDKIEEKVMVLNTSRYFNAMGWTSFETNIPKATITPETSFDEYAQKMLANDLYSHIYKQLADYAGIDPSVIISGSEASNIDVTMYLDGQYIKDAKQEIELKTQSALIIRLFIHKDSQYYNPTPDGTTIDIPVTIWVK